MEDDLFVFDDKSEEVFKNADVKKGGKFETPPDGKYQVQVDKVSMEKKNDKRSVNWHLRILNGDFAGKLLFTNSQLDSGEVGIKILKQNLDILGITLDSLAGLKDTLPELLDKRIAINKVTNKANPKFYAIYFNDLLDVTDDEDNSEV